MLWKDKVIVTCHNVNIMSRIFQLNVVEDTLERPHHNRKLTEKGYRKRVDLSKTATLHHGRTLGWVEENGISKASSAELDDIYLYARCINGIGGPLSVSLTLRRPCTVANDPSVIVDLTGTSCTSTHQVL
jgi:hypothetical protein